MRVLVTGLGDIARKAYLPVLGPMSGLELHLATRNRSALAEVGAAYGITNLHSSVEEALTTGEFDAALVHAATEAHPALVRQLLAAGVSVFVDKPLADSFDAAAQLVALAEAADRLLMVGFNRRFAPGYAALRNRPREFCLMQKHRRGPFDTPRRTVFDDFIHVVDTLQFLAPAPPERVSIETLVEGGLLRSATVMLASAGHCAVGSMSRASGLDEERLDVVGGGVRRSVLDLSERREAVEGRETVERRPDWASVGRQRGFEAMCADFLDGVREGRRTASADILATHRLCEAIVTHAEAN
ncbi:Gfo/Idh/MocA family oxidoreductase [Sphingomonas sp.]|uniref:Gfo/Idh/MocA family protein n=1 Tax=Sphingomonas sp. TaxID=28214 RepID=UPI0025F7679C|nr:Gfo/Idh/MocA family oxidoreductase [Sphingomonas sp.]MBV9528985.1 Gfo/Idh/MocA family oxidoreductase [Sphingomonas sp.]